MKFYSYNQQMIYRSNVGALCLISTASALVSTNRPTFKNVGFYTNANLEIINDDNLNTENVQYFVDPETGEDYFKLLPWSEELRFGQVAWYGIELDEVMLVRSIDFIATHKFANYWNGVLTMNGQNVWVGNVKEDVLQNTICGQDIFFSQVHSCKLIGQYIFGGGTFDFYPNPNSDKLMFVFAEIGVHTTVDIAPETTVSFSGETSDDQNDPYLTVEVVPQISSCNFAGATTDYSDLYECFRADSEGWLKIDIGGPTLIESIRMTYPVDQEYFQVLFSSEGTATSNQDYDTGGYGFVTMINREEEYIQVYLEAGQEVAQILLTLNCGEPDYSYFPSQVIQGQTQVVEIILPSEQSIFDHHCVTYQSITIMNDPVPTFLIIDGTEMTIAAAQCEEPGIHTIIFSYPSYSNPVYYELEIIEDPDLSVDSIEPPTLRQIEFVTGYNTSVWQECIFALKTSSDTEAAFCGSFTYAFSSDSGTGIEQYVSQYSTQNIISDIPISFPQGTYEVTITCSLDHYAEIEPAVATFEIVVKESCEYPEYWTGCLSYTNLAKSRPVFSTRNIFYMEQLSEYWENGFIFLTDGNLAPQTFLHTEVYAEGETGWLSVQLDTKYRIREIDLTNSRPILANWIYTNPYTINGAFLSVGLNFDSSLNSQCGSEIDLSQSYACDLIGNYIGLWFISDGVQVLDEGYYGEGRHISLQEIGAFTTVNIGPMSTVTFDGDTTSDTMLAVEGPKEQMCDEQTQHPCFEAITEGTLTVDFQGTVFIHFFKLLGQEVVEWEIEWSSTAGTWQYIETFGTEYRLLREEQTFKITVPEEKMLVAVYFYASCGEPDLSSFPSEITQTEQIIFEPTLPSSYSQFSDICSTDQQIQLIDHDDFISQSGNQITIYPDPCIAADDYEFTFAYPSYYENMSHIVTVQENQDRLIVAPIIAQTYQILDSQTFTPINFEFQVVVGDSQTLSSCETLNYELSDDSGLSDYVEIVDQQLFFTDIPDSEFTAGEYQITIMAYLPDFTSTEAKSSVFSVFVEDSCNDAQYWVICNLAANLARNQPVTSSHETFDIYSSFTALTNGLYIAKLGLEEDPGHSACTSAVLEGETAYMTVELEQITRVRTVDVVSLTDQNDYGLGYSYPYTWADGAQIVIGNSQDWQSNSVCDVVQQSSVHDCDLSGIYVSFVLEAQQDAPFCLTEIGVHSTINVAPYSEISFSGSSDYDSVLIIQGQNFVTCDNQQEFPCFEASSDGWILIEFSSQTNIDMFRLLSDSSQDFQIEFDTFPEQTVQGTWGNEWKIDSALNYVSIELLAGQSLASIMLTMNCGSPNISDFPSEIQQGLTVEININLPNDFEYWSNLCESSVQILNDPSLNFLELDENQLEIQPHGCSTPGYYTVEFGFPSYPQPFSLGLYLYENLQWTLTTSQISTMNYIISVSEGIQQDFSIYKQVGDTTVIYDCFDVIISVEDDNDLSQYILIEDQTIIIDFLPNSIEDGLYSIILVIYSIENPAIETKRGFYLQIGNACSYLEFWQSCSQTQNIALNTEVAGSEPPVTWITYNGLVDGQYFPFWIQWYGGAWYGISTEGCTGQQLYGEMAYLFADLVNVYRVRTVVYSMEAYCERQAQDIPLYCHQTLYGQFRVGNLENYWENEACGAETYFGGSKRCDLVGQYVGLSKIVDYDPGFFMMCIAEMSVLTTMDILPYSTVTFDGSSEHDVSVLYGDSGYIAVCDQAPAVEGLCFYVDETGWLTIDFNSPALISMFAFASNMNAEFSVEWTTDEGVPQHFPRLYGSEFQIENEQSQFKILFDVGQNNSHIVITMNCGQPDTSSLPSEVFIQSGNVEFEVPLPSYSSQWDSLCTQDLFVELTNFSSSTGRRLQTNLIEANEGSFTLYSDQVPDPIDYQLHLGYPSYTDLSTFEISFLDICYINFVEVPGEIIAYNSANFTYDYNLDFNIQASTQNGEDCGFLSFEIFSEISELITLTESQLSITGGHFPVGTYSVLIDAIVSNYPSISTQIELLIVIGDACDIIQISTKEIQDIKVPANALKEIELEEQIFERGHCEEVTVSVPNLPHHLQIEYDYENMIIQVLGSQEGEYELTIIAWVDGFPEVRQAEIDFTVTVENLQVCQVWSLRGKEQELQGQFQGDKYVFDVPRYVQEPRCGFDIEYQMMSKIKGVEFDYRKMQIISSNLESPMLQVLIRGELQNKDSEGNNIGGVVAEEIIFECIQSLQTQQHDLQEFHSKQQPTVLKPKKLDVSATGQIVFPVSTYEQPHIQVQIAQQFYQKDLRLEWKTISREPLILKLSFLQPELVSCFILPDTLDLQIGSFRIVTELQQQFQNSTQHSFAQIMTQIMDVLVLLLLIAFAQNYQDPKDLTKLSFLLHLCLLNVPLDAFTNTTVTSLLQIVNFTPQFVTRILPFSIAESHRKYETIFKGTYSPIQHLFMPFLLYAVILPALHISYWVKYKKSSKKPFVSKETQEKLFSVICLAVFTSSLMTIKNYNFDTLSSSMNFAYSVGFLALSVIQIVKQKDPSIFCLGLTLVLLTDYTVLQLIVMQIIVLREVSCDKKNIFALMTIIALMQLADVQMPQNRYYTIYSILVIILTYLAYTVVKTLKVFLRAMKRRFLR